MIPRPQSRRGHLPKCFQFFWVLLPDIQTKFLSQRSSCLFRSSPINSNSPKFEQAKAFHHGRHTVSISTPTVIVIPHRFSIASYVFCKREWPNLARDGVFPLGETRPILSGWCTCTARGYSQRISA